MGHAVELCNIMKHLKRTLKYGNIPLFAPSPSLIVFCFFFGIFFFSFCVHHLKEHVALDRTSWSLKRRCEMQMVRKIVQEQNMMIHISITQNCTVFLLRRELTRQAILWSQNFDTTKWPTVFVLKRKRKTVQFRGMFVWIIIF